MARTVEIELEAPLVDHTGTVAKVVLREPRYAEVMSIGRVATLAQADGSVFEVENEDAIRRYVEACLVEPKSPAILAQASLTDALRIREAVLDFFRDAGRKMFPRPSTSSSST